MTFDLKIMFCDVTMTLALHLQPPKSEQFIQEWVFLIQTNKKQLILPPVQLSENKQWETIMQKAQINQSRHQYLAKQTSGKGY